MTSIREAKKRLTRGLILDAARGLFETRGYAATTVDEIAAAAGTTRATLYLHFASKADLLESLVRAVDEYFDATDVPPLSDVVRTGDPCGIRDWLERKLDQWVEIRPSFVMVIAADADPDIAAIVHRWHGEVISRMRAALDEAGRFDPATRELRCTIAFGALEFLSRRFIRAGGWGALDRDIALGALSANWMRLLAAPPP